MIRKESEGRPKEERSDFKVRIKQIQERARRGRQDKKRQ